MVNVEMLGVKGQREIIDICVVNIMRAAPFFNI
jgi:hypothetical protein